MLTFNLTLYSGHQPQLEVDIIRKLPATGKHLSFSSFFTILITFFLWNPFRIHVGRTSLL